MTAITDKWSQWLLEKRFGNDVAAADRGMRMLYGVRDSILDEAKVAPVETVREIFSPEEFVLFEEHARPLLERGGRPYRSAFALLSATKAKEADHA
jgi:hypothetical protein